MPQCQGWGPALAKLVPALMPRTRFRAAHAGSGVVNSEYEVDLLHEKSQNKVHLQRGRYDDWMR